MDDPGRHTVGLRELRHRTGAVLSRVRSGETIDITEYGRLVARIVPAPERTPGPALSRLAEAGRLIPSTRPGYRPQMRAGDGTDRLGNALAELRDEQER